MMTGFWKFAMTAGFLKSVKAVMKNQTAEKCENIDKKVYNPDFKIFIFQKNKIRKIFVKYTKSL